MCPEFFHIGPLALRAYGLMLALSFFIGLALIVREARRLGVDPERASNLAFLLIAFGVLGARIGYVVYHPGEFADHPFNVINPFASGERFGIAGLNLQGGMLLAFIAGWIYVRRSKISFPAMLDTVVPAVAFGIFLTRIGCFLNGCCFGVPASVPWAVTFPPESPAYAFLGATAVHPTQLYSSAYGLVLFLLLFWINGRPHRVGVTTSVFFMMEAVFRFAIEFVRYYETEMWFQAGSLRMTYNQLVAAGLFLVGVFFWWNSRRAALVNANARGLAPETSPKSS
jgi:phosphatidylglycerol:prolipoprotein diacylglycerol transferase